MNALKCLNEFENLNKIILRFNKLKEFNFVFSIHLSENK